MSGELAKLAVCRKRQPTARHDSNDCGRRARHPPTAPRAGTIAVP